LVYAKDLEKDLISSSDFAIYLSNLPKDKNEKDIENFLKERINIEFKIEKVNFTYDINELVTLIRKN
jgi:hypothetical protein